MFGSGFASRYRSGNDEGPGPFRTVPDPWFLLEEASLRGTDLNCRPLGYEPSELPDCSTPRLDANSAPLEPASEAPRLAGWRGARRGRRRGRGPGQLLGLLYQGDPSVDLLLVRGQVAGLECGLRR